jgi:serine/threonine protein kinase
MGVTDPQVMAIFCEALECCAPQERAAYLDQACGSDTGLRARIESLLQAHGQAGDFLGGSLASGPIATLDEQPVFEGLGDRIGPYRLMEQIGEGGMGLVFVAEQVQPVRRRVALKLIKPGMDSRAIIARFEAERQALALMDHPNIATVLDAGTTRSGRPYFVMELVKGVPITEFCDHNRLPPRARLGLFVSVCQAVQHAHQKGIIHRDVKPSNVLVTMHEGSPVVKMIDFGVAKAIGQRLTEKTLYTAFTQMVGTPLYMSPEQAGISGLDVDTRTDIYALGVLLYELLTGTTPFEVERLRQASFDEIRRIIREEEPPKPSTRISTLGPAAATVSAGRQSDPKKLCRLLLGELDWIAMKAIEKDRDRRYESASAIAADVQRYLDDEPVLACPPSRRYRLRKFTRRYKAALVTAGLVVTALLAGTAVATWQSVRAMRAMSGTVVEKQRADEQAAIATSVTKYLQQMLGSVQPQAGKGRDYTVRQLLDDYADDLEKQLPNEPEVEATLQATLGRAYASLGQHTKARKHLMRALVLRRSVFGEEHEKYADSLVDCALPTDFDRREGLEREANLRRAVDIYRARGVVGESVIHALRILQWILIEQAYGGVAGKWEEIEAVSMEALAEARKSPGTEFPEIAYFLGGLVSTKLVQSKQAEAETIARESLAMRLRLIGPQHLETAWGYYILAAALRAQRKFTEALQADQQALTLMRKLLPPEHKSIAQALAALLSTLETADNSQELAGLFPSVAELDEWESVFREVLTTTKASTFKEDDPVLAAVRGLAQFSRFYLHLSQALASAGKTKEAEESRQKAALVLEGLQSQLAGDPDLLPYVYSYGAVALTKAGQLQQANELCRKLLLDQGSPKTGAAQNHLAWFLATAEVPAHRDPALAVQLAKKAVESNPQSGSYRNTLGVARYRAGDWKQAISDLKGGHSYDWFFLALAHWQTGNKEEARKCYDRAVECTTENEELRRFRAEAAELLGVKEKPD